MKLEYLKEFITVARIKNFTLAAEELYITQSSLSKHIMLLEKELGVQLFDRSSRNIVVSSIGEKLLSYAIEICEINNQIELSVAQYKYGEEYTLSITSIPVMAQYNITNAITQFKVKYPYIKLTIESQEGCTINHSLESKESELGFQRVFDNYEPHLEYLPFKKDLLVAVLPTSHPLSSQKTINLLDVSEDNFMLLDKNTMLYNLSYNACIKAGFRPNISYIGNRPENLIELVRNGMGIALLMKKQADYFKQDGIVSIPIKPVIENTIYLTRLKGQKPSTSAINFWEFIRENNNS